MHIDIFARLLFTVTIAVHYLFSPLSIGLGMWLILLQALFLKTQSKVYLTISRFWLKVLALNFAAALITGIVLESMFSQYWSGLFRFVEDIFVAATEVERVVGFSLELGCLAALLFFWRKLSPWLRLLLTLGFTLGAANTAFWICSANSWQQTPTSYHLVHNGMGWKAEITDFWAMILNPSSIPRFWHVFFGGWLQVLFLVMSVSAYYILQQRHMDFAKKSFTVALITAALVMPVQGIFGSRQGEIVAQYQPAKLAAMEGHFRTESHASLWLFGIPDEHQQTVRYGVAIPALLSLLAKGNPQATILGLTNFPRRDWPPYLITFIAFHVMIAIGFGLLGLSLLGVLLLKQNRLFQHRWLMRIFAVAFLGPYFANQLGWVVAEAGRQPWVIYGILRTADAIDKGIPIGQWQWTLAIFGIMLGLVITGFIKGMYSFIKHGPKSVGLASNIGRLPQ